MWRNFLIFCLFLSAAPLMVVPARADWINLTGAETAPNIAEVSVLNDRVEVALEVYVGDLKAFEPLIPDDWLKNIKVERPPIGERMAHFSEHGLRFVTDKGKTLQARVRLIEPRLRKDRYSPFAGMVNPYTRRQVPEAPADKRVLYAELVYPFGKQLPKSLTMIPPLDRERRPSASIGFIVYHTSVPVIDFRYLSGPSKLTLDWDDPWYSRFDNPNLTRHHKDALMSFLYVEPYEVRHEILIRAKDAAQWMDLGLRSERYIEIDELEPLKRRIGEFLLGKNPVKVDGEGVRPILDRSNYVKVGLGGIQILEIPERLEISTAIIGVIITYITDGMPQEVTVDWELFPDEVERIPASATDPAGALPTFLTPGDNIHVWNNYLKNYQLPTVETVAVAGSLGKLRIPWLSIICAVLALAAMIWVLRRRHRGAALTLPATAFIVLVAAGAFAFPRVHVSLTRPTMMAGTLEPQQARELLQVLLKNVYRAFDFREEEDVYDKLAISISGDQLTETYLENRRSFAVQQAGGAQAKIKSVEIEEAVAEGLDGRPLAFVIKGKWTAEGTVGHWGHVHTRRNRYDALVTVEATDGAWKITDIEILEEQRIDAAPGLRPQASEGSATPAVSQRP